MQITKKLTHYLEIIPPNISPQRVGNHLVAIKGCSVPKISYRNVALIGHLGFLVEQIKQVRSCLTLPHISRLIKKRGPVMSCAWFKHLQSSCQRRHSEPNVPPMTRYIRIEYYCSFSIYLVFLFFSSKIQVEYCSDITKLCILGSYNASTAGIFGRADPLSSQTSSEQSLLDPSVFMV